MTENPQPVAAVVRLDKSRTYSTIHGERLPGDPHAKVFYYQHGLPFSAQEILIADHPEILADPKKQEKVAQLQAKANKLVQSIAAKKKAASDEDDEEDGEQEEQEEQPPINLASWARGEQQLEWQLVTNAIAQRFFVRVKDKRGALELLIAEKVVSIGDLSDRHRKLVEQE